MSTLTNFKRYLHSQLTPLPPINPSLTFTNQTIIITGANTGLGLEAARHCARLGAARIILAVRSLANGIAAAASIAASLPPPGDNETVAAVEAWELDLSRHASIEAFARRAEGELDRLDVLVANAGVYMTGFEVAAEAGGDEMTVAVNVVGHMLLAVLLLPKMRETVVGKGGRGVVTFTGSFTHWMTGFVEREGEGVFEELKVRERARMGERYYVSKLMQLLIVREFANELTKSDKPGRIITSVVNPGFVATQIMRHEGPLFQVFLKLLQKALARTPEEGGRTLVHGAGGGEETHGEYLDDCKVGIPSVFVLSPEGDKTQKKLWRELIEKLEGIHPGVTRNI